MERRGYAYGLNLEVGDGKVIEPPLPWSAQLQLWLVFLGIPAAGFIFGNMFASELGGSPILKAVGGTLAAIAFVFSIIVRSVIWLFSRSWPSFPVSDWIPGIGVGVLALIASAIWLRAMPYNLFWSRWGILSCLIPGFLVIAAFGSMVLLNVESTRAWAGRNEPPIVLDFALSTSKTRGRSSLGSNRVRKQFRVFTRLPDDPVMVDDKTVSQDDDYLEEETSERSWCEACGRMLLATEQVTAVCGFCTRLLCEVCGSVEMVCANPTCQIRLCPADRRLVFGRTYCPEHGGHEQLGIVIAGAVVAFAIAISGFLIWS